MPNTGGKCKKLWKDTAVIMVKINKPTIVKPPFLICVISPEIAFGLPVGIKNCIIKAGITKLTTDGKNNAKNSVNSRIPFCQTIKVVMSPNGLNAPPAFAPTTMLTQLMATNLGSSLPTANTTAHIISAVVKLSAIGEIKKAKIPVSQNSAL